jgi:hypothetical protein
MLIFVRASHGSHVRRWHVTTSTAIRLQERYTRPIQHMAAGRSSSLFSRRPVDPCTKCGHEREPAILVGPSVYHGSGTDLTSYDVIKKRLLQTGYFSDTAPLHLLTATLGGTVAVTACAPIDVMKSRVQASANSVNFLHR